MILWGFAAMKALLGGRPSQPPRWRKPVGFNRKNCDFGDSPRSWQPQEILSATPLSCDKRRRSLVRRPFGRSAPFAAPWAGLHPSDFCAYFPQTAFRTVGHAFVDMRF